MSNVNGSFRGAKYPPSNWRFPIEPPAGALVGAEASLRLLPGFDEQALAFRHKSPDRVIEDLRALLDAYPTRIVSMTDAIRRTASRSRSAISHVSSELARWAEGLGTSPGAGSTAGSKPLIGSPRG